MTLIFAPGESDAHVQSFSPSALFFWLKAEMGVSDTRIAHKIPNTVLGIPLGSQDTAIPLNNVAGVSVNKKFHAGRFIFGFVVTMASLAAIAESAGAAVWLLLGLAICISSFKARLDITNNGGGTTSVAVSIFERRALETFRAEVDQRLFANQSQLRHVEMVDLQQQQLTATLMNTQLTNLQHLSLIHI